GRLVRVAAERRVEGTPDRGIVQVSARQRAARCAAVAQVAAPVADDAIRQGGPEAAVAAVHAAFGAGAVVAVAVTLHHLHAVVVRQRVGRLLGPGPADRDALVTDVLRLADGDRDALDVAVHERQRAGGAGGAAVGVGAQLRAAVGAAGAGDRMVLRVQEP